MFQIAVVTVKIAIFYFGMLKCCAEELLVVHHKKTICTANSNTIFKPIVSGHLICISFA